MSTDTQPEAPEKQATADRIREQALVLYANRGFNATATRDVANATGISPGLVTYHYPKKADLFRAAITVPYEAFVADLRRCIQATDRSPRDRLRDVINRLGSLSATETLLIRAVFRELVTAPEHLSDLIGVFRSGHVTVIVTAINDAAESGALPKGVGAGLLPALMGATVLPAILVTNLQFKAPKMEFADAILGWARHDLLVLLGLE